MHHQAWLLYEIWKFCQSTGKVHAMSTAESSQAWSAVETQLRMLWSAPAMYGCTCISSQPISAPSMPVRREEQQDG